MTKKTFNTREKWISGTLIVLLFALWGQRGVYLPLKNRREALLERIAASETQLNKNFRIIRKSQGQAQKYAALLAQFRQKGTEDQEMSAMLSEIEQASAGVEVQVVDMKPQKVRKETFVNHFTVSIILDGVMANIITYIHQLQLPPHLFQVEELRLERKSFQGKDLKCYLVLGRILIQK